MRWQVNLKTVHHTYRIIRVETQITIFQSFRANVPARHTHLEKLECAM